MYEPSTGRWMSEDPIAFNGGDVNLYRYVGNDATNATDPSGLVEIPGGETGDNKPKSDIVGMYGAVDNFFGLIPSKESLVKDMERLTRDDLEDMPKGSSKHEVIGGRWWAGKLPPKTVVGPTGCGPCLGLILVPPDKDGVFYVFHFSDMDSFGSTIPAVREKLGNKSLKGYTAIVNGGIQTGDPDEYRSRHTLRWMKPFLTKEGVKFTKYVAGPAMLIDRDGTICWGTSRTVDVSGY